MLQSMGSQTARHNRATEQQQQNIYLDKRKLKKKNQESEVEET